MDAGRSEKPKSTGKIAYATMRSTQRKPGAKSRVSRATDLF